MRKIHTFILIWFFSNLHVFQSDRTSARLDRLNLHKLLSQANSTTINVDSTLVNNQLSASTIRNSLRAPSFKPGLKFAKIVKPSGATAILRCQAEGNPTPNITWMKNENPIRRKINIRKRSWMLIIRNLRPLDRGNYTCILTNEFGSINGTYRVYVKERLSLRPICHAEFPKNLTVQVGENAKLECLCFEKGLQLHFKWFKHYKVKGSDVSAMGAPYITSDTGADVSNEAPHILHFTNVSMENAGKYTCVVGNSIGINERSAWLTVIPHESRERYLQNKLEEIERSGCINFFQELNVEDFQELKKLASNDHIITQENQDLYSNDYELQE